MIEAIRDGMDVMMERDGDVVMFGEDRRGSLRRRVSRHAGSAGGLYGHAPLLRHADQRTRHRRRRRRHGGLRAASVRRRSSSPTTCIRPTTRSSPRRHGCATGRTGSSPARSSCACRPAGRGPPRRTHSPRGVGFTHVCGLKTAVPSNPGDAKGLLIAAIEDPTR